MSIPAVSFRQVSFAYRKLEVLSDICLEIPNRRISCIVGPNGGGKSTLLRLILGLLSPKEGEIKVLGEHPQQSRNRIGYMPQYFHFDPQFPIDVASIVRMGRLNGNRPGFFNRKDHSIVDRVLDEVELLPLKNEAFRNLSGGQKQRVLIARALAVEPEILLLDEPTAMVDAHIEAHLLAKLRELHQRMTIVLVSHDASFVSELVDQVICVNRHAEIHPTRPVEKGEIQELYPDRVKAVHHHHDLADHHHD